MRDGRVDLHIHSNRSCDGDFPPAELIRMARENNFRAISIADHDTVAAYPEAFELGLGSGVEVIPGMEVTTLFNGREFHLLLPFLEWEHRLVGELITRMEKSRLEEAQDRVAKLRRLGFDLSWEEVREKSDGIPPLGVKIAQVLMEKEEREEKRKNPALAKYFRSDNRPFAPYHFYKDYFMEGRPAYVRKKHVSLLAVLEIAPECGSVPVLSHPGAYFQQTTEEDLRLLKDKGLCGLEVYTSYHSPEQVVFYKNLAGELDLVPTAGSDFHGKIKPHIPFGYIHEGTYGMVEELKRRRGG